MLRSETGYGMTKLLGQIQVASCREPVVDGEVQDIQGPPSPHAALEDETQKISRNLGPVSPCRS